MNDEMINWQCDKTKQLWTYKMMKWWNDKATKRWRYEMMKWRNYKMINLKCNNENDKR